MDKDTKMINKINKIERLIEEIIQNAINEYESQFDENNGMSVQDWENGYSNTIISLDGTILEYIPYNNFKSLYSNFKYDIEEYDLKKDKVIYKVNEKVLDKIIEYLKEEINYTYFYDLDRENYSLDEFKEMVENE